jgi:ATP-dependent Clp protease ATP-binding subunit ClpB
VIQKELLNELSKQIIAGNLNTGETVSVDSFGDRLVFNNKG